MRSSTDIQRPRPRRPRIRIHPTWNLPVLTVLLVLLAGGSLSAAENEGRILRRAPLGGNLVGEIRADGSLILRSATADEPALSAVLVSDAPRRRPNRKAGELHVGRAAEGGLGGQRGFSKLADDDGDGRVDEDRLDGRDNDGDGLIDEDFAAVGDHMLTVDRGADGRIEFYSWAHPHLQDMIFAAPSAGTAIASPLVWSLLTAGSDWIETEVRGLRHLVTGRAEALVTPAYVSLLPAAATGGEPAWLGVAVLDEPVFDGAGRTVLDGRELDIRLGENPVAVSICRADTWLGLVRLLTEARVVRDGVTDPVTRARVPWVVAPICAFCRTSEVPAFRWSTTRQGHLLLSADVGPRSRTQLDPDRFRIGGHALGAPDQILWRPADDDEVGVGWYGMEPGRLARTGVGLADPYLGLGDLVEHGGEGTIVFRFRTPPAGIMTELAGSAGAKPATTVEVALVNGTPVQAELEPDLSAIDPVRSATVMALARDDNGADVSVPGDQARLLQNDHARPTLAPDLLTGGPNPFRDVISLRVRIPTTMGEAFVWEKTTGAPAGFDSEAAIPWSTGDPQVTVKVYSLSGRELITLHEGSYVSGEVTVQWNGTDSFGRKVAAGTYFCKLQLDDWTTTRRVVFMR